MAEFSSRYRSYKSHVLAAPTNQRLMLSAQQAFAWIDRVPARLTAAGFAVVGNFEDAIDCWRQQARLWKQDNDGVLLAAAAGAVGIALGGQSAPEMAPDRSRRFDHGALPGDATAEGSTPGAPPQIGHLRSVVGLVWRSMVLWMLLLALLSLANLLG